MAGYKSPHLRLHGNPGMKSQGAPQGSKARTSEKAAGGHPAGEHVEAAPHGEHSPEHVTKTHPGETQAHPVTGVHAVHTHHIGGGKYMQHTHHGDGSVTSEPHENLESAQSAERDSFPTAEGDDAQHDQNADNDSFGSKSMMNMSSLGGE